MFTHQTWINQDDYRANEQTYSTPMRIAQRNEPRISARPVNKALFTSKHRTIRSDDRWIMDTGCSAHMTGNWSLMRNTQKCNKTVYVTTALGEKAWATHVGTVDIVLK